MGLVFLESPVTCGILWPHHLGNPDEFRGGSLVKTVWQKATFVLIGCLMLGTTPVRAQSGPEAGGNEVQVCTGGGHGLNGSTSDTGVWNLDRRYGQVLRQPF